MATSNSTASTPSESGSTATTTSSAGSALSRLTEATDILEDFMSAMSHAGSTMGSNRSPPSQVTVRSLKSQYTVQGSLKSGVYYAPASAFGGASAKSQGGSPKYGGLTGDPEGKETRKQMLIRRRKECSADEVEVALAPVMKIPIPYCFYPDQYKRFRAMFPRVNPDSGLAYTHHDHPVAHTATMVGIRRIQGMLTDDELVLDLHGNPNGNEHFNNFNSARIRKRPHLPKPPLVETLVEEKTASDAVRRVTKWGPEFRDGIRRYYNMPIDQITPGLYDVFTSIHTLYYYSMYEVNALLAKNPRAKMFALVNFEDKNSGTLYNELKYVKNDGMTVQSSPNGERYSHPDIDPWFQTNSFRGLTETLGCGIAWTSTNIGGPLYILTITRCEWGQARHHRYEPPGAPTLKVSDGHNFFGFVKIGGATVQLKISNHALASELRHYMVFRDRANPEVFESLCVKARRATSKDQIAGSSVYDVDDGQLQDHIVYAYLVDAPGELELMEGVKLLRGDLLAPLAQALKLQGDNNSDGIIRALFSWALSRKLPAQSLGVRKKQIQHNSQPPNSGGLVPGHRV